MCELLDVSEMEKSASKGIVIYTSTNLLPLCHLTNMSYLLLQMEADAGLQELATVCAAD